MSPTAIETAREAAQAICTEQGWSLEQHVGSGAFKHTFAAQTRSGLLALKVFDPAARPDRNDRELAAMQRCEHPHLAGVLQWGTTVVAENPYSWFTEEFLAGGTLEDRLRADGVLSRHRLVALGGELISAVGALNTVGLVHRDIKPANVGFREDGSSVLFDLGLVRVLDECSLTASWMAHGPGTPVYSSPEQRGNDKEVIGWRSDQYCLGLTLFVAAFGQHPHAGDGASAWEVVERIEAHEPIRDWAAEKLAEHELPALNRMLEPHIVHRYRRVDELAAAWQGQKTT